MHRAGSVLPVLLAVVHLLVQLLHRRPTLVWDLVEAPAHPQAGDVTIRDVAGAFVAYARPTVR